jgi:hypothetical protein
MKKQVIVLLLLACVITNTWNLTKSDSSYPAPFIQIQSPIHTTYHNGTMNLDVLIIQSTNDPYPINNIFYSIGSNHSDAYMQTNWTKSNIISHLPNGQIGYDYYANATLFNLSDGDYFLNVLYTVGNSTSGSSAGSSVNFSVDLSDDNPSPTVPEFPITASLVVVLAAVTLLLVIGKRKLTAINH